ncbi:hypothetical protein D3C72_1903930 [compost metagenome]
MRNFNPGQLFRDAGRQFVSRGNLANHRAERSVVIGLLPAGIERTAKISGAGANGQRVRRAPVLNLVNGKAPFVEQWRILPAKVERLTLTQNPSPCLSAVRHGV